MKAVSEYIAHGTVLVFLKPERLRAPSRPSAHSQARDLKTMSVTSVVVGIDVGGHHRRRQDANSQDAVAGRLRCCGSRADSAFTHPAVEARRQDGDSFRAARCTAAHAGRQGRQESSSNATMRGRSFVCDASSKTAVLRRYSPFDAGLLSSMRIKGPMMSNGNGNTMVEFLSAAITVSVSR